MGEGQAVDEDLARGGVGGVGGADGGAPAAVLVGPEVEQLDQRAIEEEGDAGKDRGLGRRRGRQVGELAAIARQNYRKATS